MTAADFTLVASDSATLIDELDIEPGAFRTRRIFKGAGVTLIRLAFDAGQVMKEHTAVAPILVQVLSGHAAMHLGDERIDLPAGAIIHIDTKVPHSVEAVTATQLLLTLCERPSAPATESPS